MVPLVPGFVTVTGTKPGDAIRKVGTETVMLSVLVSPATRFSRTVPKFTQASCWKGTLVLVSRKTVRLNVALPAVRLAGDSEFAVLIVGTPLVGPDVTTN